ncbi:MAG: molybdopterin-dependent oxidoreductase [Pseudorhizobium sp.]
MNNLVTAFLILLCVLLTGASPGSAADLAVPHTDPILSITGSITSTNSPGAALFDREMLEALGTDTIITKTPWFDGETEFSGVRLDELLRLVGAQGKSVTAVALNDYVTTIPISDFAQYKVILALKRDGKYMSVRDKGPLFIIYPFDSDSALQSQTYFGRAAWQVAKLIVE